MDRAKLKFFQKWQKKLRLQDWDIDFREVRRYKKKSTQVGETAALSLTWQSASVSVKKGLSKVDWQRTILHELLHVRFASCSMEFAVGTGADLNMEVAIEALARVLLKESR